mmetsp:Transcript_13124/g.27088  ORF Transcript_13124/g.27088 Transcript_13124/m.27088 type:complete len:138 (-) Transcript_13124:11-424(-)
MGSRDAELVMSSLRGLIAAASIVGNARAKEIHAAANVALQMKCCVGWCTGMTGKRRMPKIRKILLTKRQKDRTTSLVAILEEEAVHMPIPRTAFGNISWEGAKSQGISSSQQAPRGHIADCFYPVGCGALFHFCMVR